ncbi:MAG: CvpA family protein [Sedimentibacter sp.]
MNYIDIIIIVFAGYSCFQGYRRGFIKTLFDTLGVVVAFFASKEFYYITENFLLNNTKLFVKVRDFFEDKMSVKLLETFEESKDIPAELKNVLSNIINVGDVTQADTFTVFVDNISIILIRSISFVITFLVIYAILVLISNLINVIFKLPLLNLTNRIFGAGTGLIKSVIVLYIIFALSSPLIGFLQDSQLTQNILSSESSKIFYDNNLILNYLSYKGFYKN